MILPIFIFLLSVSSRNNGVIANQSNSKEKQDLSFEEEFEPLNRSIVKTIKLEGGEIADCIDFYKQPSLDHPLLKNHKIQVPPQSYVARRQKQLQKIPEENVCSVGTVPMLRTTTEINLPKPNSLNHSGIFASSNDRSHQVFLQMQRMEVRKYRGASGFISIYNFSIAEHKHQYSSASIWIQSDPHYLIVGWIVGLYVGDNNPRLFIYWTADGGRKTGCYNLLCKGFVQVDPHITAGQILSPVSSYGGPIYDIKIKIVQDPKTGNWMYYAGKEETLVGYLPIELVPNLKEGAIVVAWGGDSLSGDDGISPPMGSGHKPDGDFTHAAYFKNLIYFARNYIRRFPSYYNTQTYVDRSNCFGIQNLTDYERPREYNILFGGPGGNCKN